MLIWILILLFIIGSIFYHKNLSKPKAIGRTVTLVEKMPHYFEIETETEMKLALSKMRTEDILKGNFIIEKIRMSRYLSGLLEGDPKEAIYGELVRPVSKLPLSNDGLLDYGFQYIVPRTFEGELASFKIKKIVRLPEWLYSLELRDESYEKKLSFFFWSDKILADEELKEYVNKNANLNLTQEYFL
jgi:hypothetical protein